MKIALAQLNPTVGDIAGNAQLVLDAAQQAHHAGAALLVTSELVLSGYPPKDSAAARRLCRGVRSGRRSVGEGSSRGAGRAGRASLAPGTLPPGRLANACSLLADGRVAATVHKMLLPNYDVFDERRYFRPADRRAADRVPRPQAGRAHLRRRLVGRAANVLSRSIRRSCPIRSRELAAAGAGPADQPVGQSVRDRQAGPPRCDSSQRHVADASRAVRVRQSGRRQRRPGVRRPQLRAERGRARMVLQLPGFESRLASGRSRPSAAPVARESARQPARAQLLDALVLGLRDYMRKSRLHRLRARAVRRHRQRAGGVHRGTGRRAPSTCTAC